MCSTELVFSDDEIAVLSKIPEMAKKIKEGNFTNKKGTN